MRLLSFRFAVGLPLSIPLSSREVCHPRVFLGAHSPKLALHNSAPARQSWLLLLGLEKSMEAETPLLHADHTRFSSVKPHWKPRYAHDKSEPGAFLHLPAGARLSS